jgi:tetratricopeptide (TPR) repeat protein
VLEKLDEKGVEYEAIPIRLEKAASGFIDLRERLNRFTNEQAELAAICEQARVLIESGAFDLARGTLRRGREIARGLQIDADRIEAEFLADEARICHLQLDYRSAAAKYAEAASLVASADRCRQRTWLLAQAGELYDQGNESQDDAITDAIAIYRQCLVLTPRDRDADSWAAVQNKLGEVFAALGLRNSEVVRLEEAVAAYRAAMEVWTLRSEPLLWMAVQEELGDVLYALGKREPIFHLQRQKAYLEQALIAYRAALGRWRRGTCPLAWAEVQVKIGNVLCSIGFWGSTKHYEEAVGVYGAALEEFTRYASTLDCAIIQYHLAHTLMMLGERPESGTARLEEALKAYRIAMELSERVADPNLCKSVQKHMNLCSEWLSQRRATEPKSFSNRLVQGFDYFFRPRGKL